MRNATGHDQRLRRAAGTYHAADGETIDVHPNDVPTLKAIGFVVDDVDQLDGASLTALREVARDRDIPGRSTMTRDELLVAIRATEE
jgi:hypothetical protein